MSLVARPDWDVDTDSTDSPPGPRPLPPPQGPPLAPVVPPAPEVGHNRLLCIRDSLAKGGYSEGVWKLILQGYKHPSDKKGTLRQYEKVWDNFVSFCERDTKRALSFEAKDVANFASKMFDDGATGTAVNAAITALDETRSVVDPSLPPLGEIQVIKKLRKAAKKRRPPKRKSTLPSSYFDPILIFKHLSRLGKDIKFSLDKMRTKVAALLLLDGGLRGNELCKIFIENLKLEGRKAEVKIPWTKEEEKIKWTFVTFHCSCVGSAQIKEEKKDEKADELWDYDLDFSDFEMAGPMWRLHACSFCTLKEYLKHPRVIKRRSNCPKETYESPEGKREGSPLLLTHKGPAKGIALQSLRKELKAVMKEAKVNHLWNVHDCRGACVSKLFNLGCSKRRCREYGRWTNSKTLDEHYIKLTSYREHALTNELVPTWELLRLKVTEVNES